MIGYKLPNRSICALIWIRPEYWFHKQILNDYSNQNQNTLPILLTYALQICLYIQNTQKLIHGSSATSAQWEADDGRLKLKVAPYGYISTVTSILQAEFRETVLLFLLFLLYTSFRESHLRLTRWTNTINCHFDAIHSGPEYTSVPALWRSI